MDSSTVDDKGSASVDDMKWHQHAAGQ